MKNLTTIIFLIGIVNITLAQEFKTIHIDAQVTDVQPMTGMVFWPGNKDITTDAISLEYSYMDFSQIVTSKSVYNWAVVDDLLNEISSRNHQAVLRFRFSYPGRTTTVPQYIKELADYNETEGISEGNTTWFPDWTHEELKRFTIEFYEKYAERYDNDPRLAFVQVGFGLWAEYHIYDGPFELGVTFPDKAFQTTFMQHLGNVFEQKYWSISIDAADNTYSPFAENTNLLNIKFGMFDDSFMHQTHASENELNWNFFDRNRYKSTPAGGEFSYYSDYDQRNVLNPDEGAYGDPYEIWAQNYHITYINANDQNNYHSLARIKEASLASGYIFKLTSVKSKTDSTVINIINKGVAPIYVDAFLAVNGVRSNESLKLLAPDETREFYISAGADNPTITIESDAILPNQSIQFYGTENEYSRYVKPEQPPVLGTQQLPLEKIADVFPTIADSGYIFINYKANKKYSYHLYNSTGKLIKSKTTKGLSKIRVDKYPKGIYILFLQTNAGQLFKKKLIFN